MLDIGDIFRTFAGRVQKLKNLLFFAPSSIIIEPTNACNLSCRICAASEMLVRNDSGRGFMDYKLFEEILKKIKRPDQKIHLYFRGEPLLHPEIISFIAESSRHGFFTTISTNSLLMNEEMCERLISSGLDRLQINYDNILEEDYPMIRGIDEADTVLRNIMMIQEMKTKLHSEKPELIIKAVNPGHKPGMIRKYMEFLKLKGIKGKACITGYFVWPGTLPLDEFEINWLPAPRVCPIFNQGAAVTFDGRVLACSYDYMEASFIGNILDFKSLNSVYSDPGYKNFRKKILLKKYNELAPCKSCLMPMTPIAYKEFELGGLDKPDA